MNQQHNSSEAPFPSLSLFEVVETPLQPPPRTLQQAKAQLLAKLQQTKQQILAEFQIAYNQCPAADSLPFQQKMLLEGRRLLALSKQNIKSKQQPSRDFKSRQSFGGGLAMTKSFAQYLKEHRQ